MDTVTRTEREKLFTFAKKDRVHLFHEMYRNKNGMIHCTDVTQWDDNTINSI